MKKLFALFLGLLFAASFLVAGGCAKKEESAKPAAEPAKPLEPDKKAEEAKPGEPRPHEEAPAAQAPKARLDEL